MFNDPHSIWVDRASGYFFITEMGGCRMRMIDNNNIITTVLGKESCLQRRRLRGATTSDATVGTNTALMGLAGIWGHSARGVVFVAESSRHVVRAYHIANGTTNVVAGIDQFPDFSGDDGPASLAALNNPVFLCGSEDGADGTPDGSILHSVNVDPRDARHLYIGASGGGASSGA